MGWGGGRGGEGLGGGDVGGGMGVPLGEGRAEWSAHLIQNTCLTSYSLCGCCPLFRDSFPSFLSM